MSRTPARRADCWHSTRPLAEFIALLADHSVSLLVDVRTVRALATTRSSTATHSRPRWRPPASAMRMLPAWEASATRIRSPEHGWRNASFRGFADYMQTPEFTQNLADLIERQRTNESCSCAPKPCRGVVIARLSPTRWWPTASAPRKSSAQLASRYQADAFCLGRRHGNYLSAARR